MKFRVLMAFAVLFCTVLVCHPASAESPIIAKVPPELIAFEKELEKRTGDIAIPEAKATLHLGDRYYFLGAEQARQVITKVWGNPPTAADGVLGIVIEKGAMTYDNVWAAVVSYEPSGYVSDDDAKAEDYETVLTSMRAQEVIINERRRTGGYPTIHLVGWADPPAYDQKEHSLIWARELQISDSKVNTLNYDVRLLGREGVLSLNMLSDMNQLAGIRTAAADFRKAANFNAGSTYGDYNSWTDKAAGYGLAGLVATGTGVAVAQKLGLFAIILAFGKKFIVLIVVAGAAAVQFGRRLFGRREPEWDEAPAYADETESAPAPLAEDPEKA